MAGREYRMHLTDAQKEAVDAIQDVVERLGGCSVFGRVGCGKTRTALAAMQERALRKGKRQIALLIMPKMGGVVFDQTEYEANAIGLGGHVYVWRDNNMDDLKEFIGSAKADETPGVSCIITNIHRMDAEVSSLLAAQNQSTTSERNNKKRISSRKFSLDERARAREELYRRIGHFDQLWLDEYQNFAAASPSNDPNVEVNLQLTQYPIIDHFVRWSRPSCILGTSATPCRNHPNDIWAFLRLFASNQLQKRQLMTQTKYGSQEEQVEFKESCRKVAHEMTVVVKHDATPPSTKLFHTHSLSILESAAHDSTYADLIKVATTFKRAIQNTPAHPSAHQRAYLERCKNIFYTRMILSKRGACHPGLFTSRPMPEAEKEFREQTKNELRSQSKYEDDKTNNEKKEIDLEEDAKAIVRSSNKKFVHTREQLAMWRAELKSKWPIHCCFKFKQIIDRLAEITDERTIIMFEHTDTIELLKLYIVDAMPGREVQVYHAGLSDKARVAVLSHFKKSSADNAILLSTRGSLNQAVNVECTTNKLVVMKDSPCQTELVNRRFAVRMCFGDFAESPKDQDQCEGRCKRPRAQGYPDDPDRVQDWFVEYFYSKEYNRPTIETVLEKMSTVKSLRCANIFTEVEENEASEENTDEGNKKIINVIIDILSCYSAPGASKKRSADVRGEKLLKHRKL